MSIEKEVAQESGTSSLVVIIFSMNRAMQLDAVLRSFYRHCWDGDNFDLYIIYKTTSPTHSRQYQELIKEYSQFDRIHFLKETHFRIDLLSLLFDFANIERWGHFYKTATHLGGIFGHVTRRWIKPTSSNHVLFLVDDNIFTGDFYLRDVRHSLGLHPDSLGFSLRLGENTNYCYAHDQAQQLPHFIQSAPGIYKFNWTKAEHDFNYPLELSSSIYRISDLLLLINSRSFRNPNKLESKMAASSSLFKSNLPWLLCYSQSVTFCSPVNRIQDRLPNRTGVVYEYPVDLLAEKFDARYRIDVAAYDGFVSTGCHQEVEFKFFRNET